jgi:predicted transcriptional regulator
MDPLLNHEIGSHAGVVYKHLKTNPSTSASALRKLASLNSREVDQALGWLAREGKLSAERDGRTVRYSVA